MLVLSRKAGEEIVIDGGRIRLTVTAVKGDRVKIGIAAPADVRVDRSEIAARIAAEESAAEETVLEFACR